MQRSWRRITPWVSVSRMIAFIGQTSAHGGDSQCWHTPGISIPTSSTLKIRIRDLIGIDAFSFSKEQTTSQILQPLQALISTIKTFFMSTPLSPSTQRWDYD